MQQLFATNEDKCIIKYELLVTGYINWDSDTNLHCYELKLNNKCWHCIRMPFIIVKWNSATNLEDAFLFL